MNLFFRLLWIILFSGFRKPSKLLGPCVTPFRTLPTDLDIFRHMNNGKYFSILDLARVDMMIRTGFAKKIRKNNWYPVATSETIQFKKSLKLFDKFHVETKVLGWDEKYFIIQQHFIHKNQIVAKAIIQSRFLRKSGGALHTDEVLNFIDYKEPSPELPDWVSRWHHDQLSLREHH